MANRKSQIANRGAGFTIAELLVAMGIFVILIGIVTGIFIGGFRTQRSLVSLIAANDNAGLALEQMGREMRTGVAASFCIVDASLICNPSSTQGSAIGFTNAEAIPIVYRLDGTAISRREGASGSFEAITGNNVVIRNLLFLLSTPPPAPPVTWPPRITITLSVGSPEASLANIVTNIQTTVSGRNL
jgi:type II secretory pathway pseudopilin PulG